MKLHLLLAFSLLTISVVYAGFGVNVKQLIATKQGGVIDQDSLSYILQSQYNQYVVITSFFATGDIVANGKLTQYEFGQAYSAFMNFLFGQKPSADLIAARWVIATWEQDQAGYVNLAGFTFVVTLDLKFVHDNYCLFSINLDQTPIVLQKIKTVLADGLSSNDLLSALFFGFDYDKNNKIAPAEFRSGFRILGYLLGLNISYTTPLVNDLFSVADISGDLQLSTSETVVFINAYLNVLKALVVAVME